MGSENLKVAAQTLKFLSATGFRYTPQVTEDMIENWAESFNGISMDVAKQACVALSESTSEFPSLAQFLAQTRLIRRVEAQDVVTHSTVDAHVRALQPKGVLACRSIREAKHGALTKHAHKHEDASGCPICRRAKQEQADPSQCIPCGCLKESGLTPHHHKHTP